MTQPTQAEVLRRWYDVLDEQPPGLVRIYKLGPDYLHILRPDGMVVAYFRRNWPQLNVQPFPDAWRPSPKMVIQNPAWQWGIPLIAGGTTTEFAVDYVAQITGESAVYATARSTSSFYRLTFSAIYMGQLISGGTYGVYRLFDRFDTSTIGAGNTVSQVNLKLTSIIDASDTDFDVEIIEQDWSAQYPITSPTPETAEPAYDGCLAGSVAAIWRNTSGMSVNTPYTSPNLTAAYVNKTGQTYYSLRSSRDSGNNTPTGNEYISIAHATEDPASYRPTLIVVHAPSSNIKSVNSVARASIKKINSVTWANVKKVNSVTNT